MRRYFPSDHIDYIWHTVCTITYKLINKIGNYLYFYTLALIITIVYPEIIANRLQTNDPKYRYTPKSKRSKWMKGVSNMVTVLNQCMTDWIQANVIKWGNTRKLRKLNKAIHIIKYEKNNNNYPKRKKKGIGIFNMAMSALAMQAKTPKTKAARMIHFDTDSYEIGIDNRCSRCISHHIDDFVGNLRDTQQTIKGFGGSRFTKAKIGTIRWKWMDDEGKIHSFLIPHSFYVPEGGVRLLSPQHWAKSITGNNRKRTKGVGSETLGDRVTLFWGNKRHKLTVPLCRKTNVATFRSAPGNSNFRAFYRTAGIDYQESMRCPIIVSPATNDKEERQDHERIWPNTQKSQRSFTFDLQGPNSASRNDRLTSQSEEEHRTTNLAAEFLALHHRCGHIGFDRLKEMARQGIVPRKFANAPTPACTACMYAKAIKRKWRDKPRANHAKTIQSSPGECVSVDQLVSPTPGLVAQLTGILTTKRYLYATVYVDQATKFGFVYLQKSATAEETLQSKRAFESVAHQHGVTIRAYHADNGIFRANQWVNDCRRQHQNLTFAAVGAHHQNGYAERRIRSLQELARTMLIHASQQWPAAITNHLWPYSLRMASMMINETPNMADQDRRSPIQLFTSTQVQPNAKHWQTFGCPIYVLDKALQTNAPFHKWRRRSKVGIYLGRSPQHARNVALVLDRTTGLVSPQFHVSFDSNFTTVEQDDHDRTWQLKAGLITSIKQPTINSSLRGRNAPAPESDDIETTQMKIATRVRNDALRTERLQRRNNRKREADGGIKHPPTNSNATTPHDPIISDSEEGQWNAPTTALLNEIEHTPLTYPTDSTAVVKEITITPQNEVLRVPDVGLNVDDNQRELNTMLALKAVADPDTMYLHQAMKQDDKYHFIKAMQKEIHDQSENGNFSLIHKSKIPKGRSILPSVWQMKRKRDIRSRKIKKYKARLNIVG